ncbi:hypothetical protein C8R45DRAFT_937497 [Mycena sanguinolenta]|nr:hypothetical protein C8R45DRAFT_937497 [Mycena sanguinolenta]
MVVEVKSGMIESTAATNSASSGLISEPRLRQARAQNAEMVGEKMMAETERKLRVRTGALGLARQLDLRTAEDERHHRRPADFASPSTSGVHRLVPRCFRLRRCKHYRYHCMLSTMADVFPNVRDVALGRGYSCCGDESRIIYLCVLLEPRLASSCLVPHLAHARTSHSTLSELSRNVGAIFIAAPRPGQLLFPKCTQAVVEIPRGAGCATGFYIRPGMKGWFVPSDKFIRWNPEHTALPSFVHRTSNPGSDLLILFHFLGTTRTPVKIRSQYARCTRGRGISISTPGCQARADVHTKRRHSLRILLKCFTTTIVLEEGEG